MYSSYSGRTRLMQGPYLGPSGLTGLSSNVSGQSPSYTYKSDAIQKQAANTRSLPTRPQLTTLQAEPYVAGTLWSRRRPRRSHPHTTPRHPCPEPPPHPEKVHNPANFSSQSYPQISCQITSPHPRAMLSTE